MGTTFGQDLIASMAEAVAHACGEGIVAREHIVEVPDVRAIREGLGLWHPRHGTSKLWISECP